MMLALAIKCQHCAVSWKLGEEDQPNQQMRKKKQLPGRNLQAGRRGIIAKKASCPYKGRRTRNWLKIKCIKRQEFAIVGFTDPEKSRVGFGALLLAVNDDGELSSPARSAPASTTAPRAELPRPMDKLGSTSRAFKNPPRASARAQPLAQTPARGRGGLHRVDAEGILRHPSFQGLREDKPASEVVVETPKHLDEI